MLTLSAMEQALKTALVKIGGPTALSSKIGGLTSQAISQWTKVPAGRVIDVERATGVSRHELRPDVFGKNPEPAQ